MLTGAIDMKEYLPNHMKNNPDTNEGDYNEDEIENMDYNCNMSMDNDDFTENYNGYHKRSRFDLSQTMASQSQAQPNRLQRLRLQPTHCVGSNATM